MFSVKVENSRNETVEFNTLNLVNHIKQHPALILI